VKRYPVLLCAVVVLGCVTGDSGHVETNDGLKTFVFEDRGYEISYPAHWDESVEEKMFYGTDGMPAMGIRESFIADKDASEQVQRVKDNFDDNDSYDVKGASQTVYGAISFEWLDMTYHDETSTYESALFITTHGDYLYQFLYLAETPASLEEAIDATLPTLNFIL